ncbi:MAG: NADH-quinone oxidoreductase subunit N [Chloroflexota bacterium]|nr:NADH-quinone oxidoreductase subunit N [Chloroflexota bacterium]
MFETPTIADFLAQSNLSSTLPATLLALWTLILVLVDLFLPEERQRWTPVLACVGLGISFAANLFVYSPAESEQIALYGMFVADAFTGFLNVVILVATLIAILMSWDYLNRADIHRGEYYVLALLSSAGAMFMVGANDLIIIFVALELLSIPLYILAAFRSIKNDGSDLALKSEESGMKYFILGAFSSAFLVFGSALVYGATGTTNIPEIFSLAGGIAGNVSSAAFYLIIGAALLFVGLGFKVAVVPFHMWTPDVYEGAPTPVTAFMSVTAKIGGFAAMLRLLVTGLASLVIVDGEPVAWQATVSLVAVLTLVLGNFVAISQRNLKRMLAYSSIAHAGYILVAVAATGTAGVADAATQSALVYMLAYMFTNLGAFAVVMSIEREDGSGGNIEDITGLARSRPLMAMAMTIFMLSLTGIPLTAGFLGKFMVFASAVQAGLYGLAIIGVLTSVVSAFYYMRVVVNMYLRDSSGDLQPALETSAVRWAINIALAGTMVFGVFYPLATNLVSSVSIT